MKIRFESDGNLPLGKILIIFSLIIVVGSVSQEDNEYYPQFFLDECLYESMGELKRVGKFCIINILVINIGNAFIFNDTQKS